MVILLPQTLEFWNWRSELPNPVVDAKNKMRKDSYTLLSAQVSWQWSFLSNARDLELSLEKLSWDERNRGKAWESPHEGSH